MSKNILFVTRPTKDFYRIFNTSCLTNIERLTKKNLQFNTSKKASLI